MRFLVHAMPGLGPLLHDELSADRLESDGRNDVVVFDGTPPFPRTAEDVFVQIGESRGPRGLMTKDGLERALSVYANVVRGLRRSEGFRVVARVLNERDIARTSFRDRVAKEIQELRPKWRPADPADIEIWVAQTGPHTWRSAIRLTRTRSHRTVEREGALRPSVAAAMVRLAGAPGRLLDPCCGSGTILMEAREVGWRAVGSDLDAATSRHNGQSVAFADAAQLPFGRNVFDACVSNLPFGVKFAQTTDPQRIIDEMHRVVRPGGRVVTLTANEPTSRTVLHSIEIVLLGRRTWITAMATRSG